MIAGLAIRCPSNLRLCRVSAAAQARQAVWPPPERKPCGQAWGFMKVPLDESCDGRNMVVSVWRPCPCRRRVLKESGGRGPARLPAGDHHGRRRREVCERGRLRRLLSAHRWAGCRQGAHAATNPSAFSRSILDTTVFGKKPDRLHSTASWSKLSAVIMC